MSLNTWSLNVSLHNNKLTQANTAFSSYFETGLFRELWCERAWLWGTWVSLCCLEVLQTVNDTDLSVSMFVCNTAQGLHAERIHPVLLIQDWYQHWDQYYNTQSHVSTWCVWPALFINDQSAYLLHLSPASFKWSNHENDISPTEALHANRKSLIKVE